MPDTPLTPEEEARWRSYGGDVGKRAIDRVWATLDAARTPDVDAYLDSIPVMTAQELRRRWPASVDRLLRDAAGVRVTGDAGLRQAVERWLHAREYERMDAEGAVAALLGYEWDDTRGDGEWIKSARATPEADR